MDLKKLPDITFADADVDPDEVDLEIVTTVEALLQRKLARADPLRLFLRGIELLIIQQRIIINEKAKQNLLAFATGNILDHHGAMVVTDRLLAAAATVTLKFSLGAAREMATIIPAGTRATAGDGVMFATNSEVIIETGETSATGAATCTEVGALGNNYAPGELILLVDPVPFVASVTNTTTSEGGSDTESDDAYRERIHEAPEQFTTAGPTGAYEYFVKSVSPLIIDVKVDSPEPGVVAVYPLLAGGELPGTEILNKVLAALSDETVRPLTDNVVVEAPEAVSYNIELSYWIDRSNEGEAANIQQAAEEAVNDFITWQCSKLGRDINPTELYARLRMAGVKRVEITEPIFTTIANNQVAAISSITANFEGLEDD